MTEIEIEGDPTLVTLMDSVSRTDDKDVPVELTISLAGTVISGTLISQAQWLDANGYKELAEKERAKRESWDTARELLSGYQDDVLKTVYRSTPGLAYLHLKDARLLSGGRVVPAEGKGTLWRCKVSEVTGWSMSTLGPPDRPQISTQAHGFS